MHTATVSPQEGSWQVSWQGLVRDYAELEEAVEQARSALRSSGGGTIEIHDRAGLRDTINVQPPRMPGTGVSASPPPARVKTPPPNPRIAAMLSGSRSARPQHAAASRTPSSDAARVLELRDGYEAAREQIFQIADDVEREIALAALRLEAAHTYERLAQAQPAIAAKDLAALGEYVRGLTGGELAEWSVKQVDKLAEKAVKDAIKSAAQGVAVGVVAIVFGIVSTIFGTGEQAGAALVAAALGGGSVLYFIVRALQVGGPATEQAWIRSWSWANALGAAAERALESARALAAALRPAGVGPWPDFRPFALRARTHAKGLLALAWTLVLIGAAGVLYGASEAVNDLSKDLNEPVYEPQEPTYP